MTSRYLPTELLYRIARYILSLETLRALSCSNRRFYDIFNPLLYQMDATYNCPSLAICWAAEHGKVNLLKKSLGYGAEIISSANAFCERGSWRAPRSRHTPLVHVLCLAVRYGNGEIIEFLFSKDWKSTPQMQDAFEYAIILGHKHIMKNFLYSGRLDLDFQLKKVETQGSGSRARLLWIVEQQNANHMAQFLTAGADSYWQRGWVEPVFIFAMKRNRADMVKLLLAESG